MSAEATTADDPFVVDMDGNDLVADLERKIEMWEVARLSPLYSDERCDRNIARLHRLIDVAKGELPPHIVEAIERVKWIRDSADATGEQITVVKGEQAAIALIIDHLTSPASTKT